jgi:hypothetical protein
MIRALISQNPQHYSFFFNTTLKRFMARVRPVDEYVRAMRSNRPPKIWGPIFQAHQLIWLEILGSSLSHPGVHHFISCSASLFSRRQTVVSLTLVIDQWSNYELIYLYRGAEGGKASQSVVVIRPWWRGGLSTWTGTGQRQMNLPGIEV